MQGMKSAGFSDVEQRIRFSKFALLQSVILVVLWLSYLAWIGSTEHFYVILLVGASFLPTALLHLLRWDYLARVVWNIAISSMYLTISIAYGKDVSPEYFFFFMLGLPFLLFSWVEERKTLFIAVILQTTLSLFALSMDFLDIPRGGTVTPLSETQIQSIEWGIRITVAALLLVQMFYFSWLNSRSQVEVSKALSDANYAARSKGEFLANMSHEIRTPMNGVIGMIEVLETMDLNSQQARSVGTIRNSAFSLLRILDDILDASQIEAGKLNVEKTKVEIRPLLEGVSQTLQPMAEAKGTELRLLIDQKIPEWIWADSGRLRQILLNLLSNAIKYSAKDLSGHRGMVILNSRYYRNKQLVITIKDNGVGMNDEVRAKLFEPFMQGEQSSHRRVGGTGLGLVISKNLTELMGGRIKVESQQGEGTKVTITLPLELADGPSRIPDLTGLNVICYGVEDEIVREGLEHTLGSGGIVNRFIDDMDQAQKQIPELTNPTVVIFPPMDDEQRTQHQKRFEDLSPDLCFIHCSPVRSERFGLISQNTYRIQIFPMMTSELYQALAILSGKEPRHPAVTRSGSETTQPDLNPKNHHVLVVEDNEINKTVLSKQLEILGYPHELASDGMEGFSKWQNGEFDLILTDCHMPRMDGFELVAAVRAEEQTKKKPPVPIIAITANALEGEAEKCIAAGMDSYLAKPVELEALKSKMLKLLNEQQHSHSGSGSGDRPPRTE